MDNAALESPSAFMGSIKTIPANDNTKSPSSCATSLDFNSSLAHSYDFEHILNGNYQLFPKYDEKTIPLIECEFPQDFEYNPCDSVDFLSQDDDLSFSSTEDDDCNEYFESHFGSDHPPAYVPFHLEYNFSSLKIEGLLGRGSSGIVYRCRNLDDRKIYAVKIVKTKPNSPRFDQAYDEVRTFSQLSGHQNILKFFSAWKANYSKDDPFVDRVMARRKSQRDESSIEYSRDKIRGLNNDENQVSLFYIMMECPQYTLKSYLQTNPSINFDDAMNIWTQLVVAVDHIHSKGFVHRDISAANIFLNINGDKEFLVLLGDFGAAAPCKDISKSPILPLTPDPIVDPKKRSYSLLRRSRRDVFGTPGYSPPELARKISCGESLARLPEDVIFSTAIDVFALSVVLLELILQFKTGMERARCVNDWVNRNQLPSSLSYENPQLYLILMHCGAQDQWKRPTTTQILRYNLVQKHLQKISYVEKVSKMPMKIL